MPQNRKNTEAQTQPRPHVQTVDSTLTTTKPPHPGKASPEASDNTRAPTHSTPTQSPHSLFEEGCQSSDELLLVHVFYSNSRHLRARSSIRTQVGCRRLPTARAQSHGDVTAALTLLSEGPTTTPRFRGPSACGSYRAYRRPRSLWGALTLPDPVCEDAVLRQPLILPHTPPPLSRVSTWPSRGSRTARIRHVRACRSHVAAALGGGAARAGAPESPRHAPWARKSSPDSPCPGRTGALFLPCGLRAASQGKGSNGVSRAHKSGVGYRESSGTRENVFTKKVAPPLSGQRWLRLRGRGRVWWEGGGFFLALLSPAAT